MSDYLYHQPTDLIIYGALGDLCTRKLILSLYRLDKSALLSPDTRIIGVDLHEKTHEKFVAVVRASLDQFLGEPLDDGVWQRYRKRFLYCQIDLTEMGQYARLKELTDGTERTLINYFSVSPVLFAHICEGLKHSGILTETARMVMEKPIGHDLASSKVINDAVESAFLPHQVFRIDHYLGKETVLNLLALRFANSIFTTNWNHNTIDHIQITVGEEVGIEGRWDYFDKTGQLRDMVQNHLLQILTFIAMEPPANLQADSIHAEKIKVLKALRPITRDSVEHKTVRGRYGEGYIQGRQVPGYLDEKGANLDSDTESFVAVRVDIDNWRWAGVPFYLRTGKRMHHKRTEIVVYFKQLPHNVFSDDFQGLPPNKLIIHLQPKEGVEIEILNKIPGIGGAIKLQKTRLDLSFSEAFKRQPVYGGYERLILEALRGDPTLFLSREEIEQAWVWIDSIQQAWRDNRSEIKTYPAGSWGPVASVALMARDGRTWEE
ncbi:MAG: glucose-6-phosphate dehydrogenase [Methylococcales bacterium]|nr:glucose-6-phosphate dehydrogenase [Methylococcales bacterium]